MKEGQFRFFGYSATCDNWYGRNGARIMLPYSLNDKKTLLMYKKAGFNTLFINYVYQFNAIDEDLKDTKLIKVMDMANELGLKCFVFEKNLHRLTSRRHSLIDPENANGETVFKSEEELEQFVAKCIEQLRQHPAFIGVSTMDEPFGEMLLAYGQTVKALRKVMPDIYINANISLGYHNYLGAGQDLVTSDVDKYKKNLEAYDKTVNPPFIQFGIYPLQHRYEGKELLNGRKYVKSYLSCCCIGGEYCSKTGKDLSIIMQACEFTVPTAGWGCAKPKEADMYLQNNVLMSVGTKTYSYWSYFPVVNSGVEFYDPDASIVDTFGRPNEIYFDIQQIHGQMQKMAPILSQFKYDSADIVINGKLPKYSEHILGLVEALDAKDLKRIPSGEAEFDISGNGVLMVTLRRNDKTGEKGFFIINIADPQYKLKANFNVRFEGVKKLKVLREGEQSVSVSENGNFNFELDEGRAVFVIPCE